MGLFHEYRGGGGRAERDGGWWVGEVAVVAVKEIGIGIDTFWCFLELKVGRNSYCGTLTNKKARPARDLHGNVTGTLYALQVDIYSNCGGSVLCSEGLPYTQVMLAMLVMRASLFRPRGVTTRAVQRYGQHDTQCHYCCCSASSHKLWYIS